MAVHDAFTTRAFGDSSLIFVTDYHPLSKTLSDQHFPPPTRYGARAAPTLVSEQTLWGYLVQLASALKAIHAANLAARCLDPSKILLTSKNRLRLTAASVLDVVQHDSQRPLQELQYEDFILLGRLVLALATANPAVVNSPTPAAVTLLARSYSAEMRDTVTWLLTPAQSLPSKTVDELLVGISSHLASAYDTALHATDTLTSELSRELENGRLVRLLSKLGFINERPEYDHDRNWSEVGERYMLKLFRDYVFHQVDANGAAVTDLGHVLRCLNKLDAGSEERVSLVSRDEQTVFVVSYRELRKQVMAAFGELGKGRV